MMMKHVRLVVAVLSMSFAAVHAATAQVAYNEGPVERVVLLHILPGHFDAFMADIKKNLLPIWEAEKSSGLIVSYQMFLNTTNSGPEAWDFGFAIVYKNMATQDGLAEKVYAIRMQQYGDKTAEQKIIDKRVENARVVSSMLLRDITLK